MTIQHISKLASLLKSIKEKTHGTKLFGGSFVINSLLEKPFNRPLTIAIDSITARVIYGVNQLSHCRQPCLCAALPETLCVQYSCSLTKARLTPPPIPKQTDFTGSNSHSRKKKKNLKICNSSAKLVGNAHFGLCNYLALGDDLLSPTPGLGLLQVLDPNTVACPRARSRSHTEPALHVQIPAYSQSEQFSRNMQLGIEQKFQRIHSQVNFCRADPF